MSHHPFANYDQWKTSDPAEDYDDTICVQCTAYLPENILPNTPQDDGFCSAQCQQDYHACPPEEGQ